MSLSDPGGSSVTQPAPQFTTTHWSLIQAAGQGEDPQKAEALAELCQRYWAPLYAFVRRRGYGVHDAEDLTQEFFRRLLERNYAGEADQTRGRFRSFLLGALKHFLADAWDKARAQKRGGGHLLVALDTRVLENQNELELADRLTPEQVFDRRWALTLLDRVLKRLEAEHQAAGKGASFRALKGYLTAEEQARPYAEAAATLGTSEGAVKVAVHRLRQRYRALLHEEVASTLTDPNRVEEELRDLFAAFER